MSAVKWQLKNKTKKKLAIDLFQRKVQQQLTQECWWHWCWKIHKYFHKFKIYCCWKYNKPCDARIKKSTNGEKKTSQMYHFFVKRQVEKLCFIKYQTCLLYYNFLLFIQKVSSSYKVAEESTLNIISVNLSTKQSQHTTQYWPLVCLCNTQVGDSLFIPTKIIQKHIHTKFMWRLNESPFSSISSVIPEF